MEWTEQKDVMLAREILLCEPFKYKAGSKERGSVWSQIATNLNTHPGFTVSQRAVRDRFGILEKKAKKRKREIENGTGISPEDSELDLALEEIIEKWEAADQEFQLDNQSKAKKLEKNKETAEEMRRMSMETLGASKKRKSDPDESAEEKRCKKRRGGSDTMEFRFKREELEAKKSEQSLLTEQQKQQQQMIPMFQQQLQQQNQQQQLQQQQMQQQLQQMQTMFMESQKQQAQLMATLFQKMSEQK
ncbi:unnamed protein product [Porites evermanni]|uniref:Uncharacterized protein n=1 Tax=Porites evermanni TaxID=104178 RepID=A0ABN8SG54_9CNID|nr:unnamed protein product [Porites evermanni]